MNDYPSVLDVTATGGGVTYSGRLTAEGIEDYRIPMAVGLSPNPKEYDRWFMAMYPGLPSFARVFSGPGNGLPNLGGTINGLPPGCLPWISHKDRVPIASLVSYWHDLKEKYDPPTGRVLRWTPHHEAFPESDPAEFLPYLRSVATAAADCPWIEVVQVQSLYAMRFRHDVEWRRCFVDGVSVGFDVYPPEFGNRYEPAESILGLPHYVAGAIGAPRWYLPELGADVRTPGGREARATWITSVASHADELGCSGTGLWCGLPEKRGDRTYDYRPTDTATLRAYQDLLTPLPGELVSTP